MAKKATIQTTIINKLIAWVSLGGAVLLLVLASLAWWGGSFATNMVHNELAAQKIYFPAKGSAALDPTEFPDLQKYAGQLVDNGAKAQAYANGYINRHLQKIANGQTYAEVSTAAQADPTNQALQTKKATLFQGETLRGILLGTGYAYGTIGQIALIASLALAFAGIFLAIIAIWKTRFLFV